MGVRCTVWGMWSITMKSKNKNNKASFKKNRRLKKAQRLREMSKGHRRQLKVTPVGQISGNLSIEMR